jgi:CDP-glucose 4,6-dehydratase
MHLAERLAETPSLRGEAFNFSNEIQLTVAQIVEKILFLMESNLQVEVRNEVANEILHQYLSAEKARTKLGWKPIFNLEQGLDKTIGWYKNFFGAK